MNRNEILRIYLRLVIIQVMSDLSKNSEELDSNQIHEHLNKAISEDIAEEFPTVWGDLIKEVKEKKDEHAS